MNDGRRALYDEAGEQFAPAIARLARAMERDPDRACDLEQDIHLEIWRSLERFDGRCALKTWVFRVAHNVAADHVGRAKKANAVLVAMPEDSDTFAETSNPEGERAEGMALERLYGLIRTLPLLDAQIILLWLEGHSGGEIAEVTGLTSGAAATRVHRIRERLTAHFVTPAELGDHG